MFLKIIICEFNTCTFREYGLIYTNFGLRNSIIDENSNHRCFLNILLADVVDEYLYISLYQSQTFDFWSVSVVVLDWNAKPI